MLGEQEVQRQFDENQDFVRQIALEFLDYGKFKSVEARLNIKPGIIEKLFYEKPRYEKLFDDELSRQAKNRLFREGHVNIFKISRRLISVTNDEKAYEDGGPTIKDVVSDANRLAKLYDSVLKTKGDAKKDSLDEIWEDVSSERKSKESPPDM